jgi:hypothetical protein
VGSALGIPDEKLLALVAWEGSPLFDETERLVLEYADSMTITGRDVSDELFARLQAHFEPDAIVELTEIVAWENASSKFNRALRIPSQGLWKRASDSCLLPPVSWSGTLLGRRILAGDADVRSAGPPGLGRTDHQDQGPDVRRDQR